MPSRPHQDTSPRRSGAQRAIEAGISLSGAAASSVGGLLMAGPAGAVAGALAGQTLAETLREVTHRVLSHREQIRIGGAFNTAALALQERLEAGDSLRGDGFFNPDETHRSKAEAVLEGVLLTVQRQHEERKVEYLGYLMANLCFEDAVDSYLANWAVRTAGELSWAQLVLLSAVGRTDESPLLEITIGANPSSWSSWGIHEQLADLGLGGRHLIGAPPAKTGRLGLSVPNRRLDEQQLTSGGLLLFQLMWLDRIPRGEIDVLLHVLGAGSDGDAET